MVSGKREGECSGEMCNDEMPPIDPYRCRTEWSERGEEIKGRERHRKGKLGRDHERLKGA